MHVTSITTFLIACAFITTGAFAQSVNPVTILDTYGSGANQAVVSEPAVGAQPPLVYAGLGSGVGIIDVTTSTNPQLWTTPANGGWFSTKGFVRDLCLLRNGSMDRLYVAAHTGGLWSYKIGGSGAYPASGTQKDSSFVSFPWSVAAADITDGTNSGRFIFVGTNSDDSDGWIYIVKEDSSGLTVKASYHVSKPVYALAVATGADETVASTTTVFAGTAGGGIYRFDIGNSTFFPTPSFGSPATWNPGSPANTFVRDLLFYHASSSSNVLFAAAHGKGIYRLEVTGSGTLNATTGSPWPLVTGGSGFDIGRFDGLCFAPYSPPSAPTKLIAALGGAFAEERQYFGACSFPLPADGTSNERPSDSAAGVIVYDLNSTGAFGVSPTQSLFHHSSLHSHLHAYSVSTRAGSGSNFYVDCAADADGFQLLEYAAGSSPSITNKGEFARDDHALLGSVDDLLIHDFGSQTVLYAACEGAMYSHDITNVATGGIPTPADFADGAYAILADGMFNTSPKVLFGGGSDGVGAFTLSATDPKQMTYAGNIASGGRQNFFMTTITPASNGENWLIVVNSPDDDSDHDGPGIVIWNIAPCLNSSTNTLALGNKVRRLHYMDDYPLQIGVTPTRRIFGGVVAIDGAGSTVRIFVLYGPARELVVSGVTTANGSDDAALLELIVDTSTDPLGLTVGGYYPAFTNLPTLDPVATLTLSGSVLYAAFGCHGVAQYSLSPAMLRARAVTGNCVLGAIEDNGNVLMTCLSGGIGKVAANQLDSGTISYFNTPMQANQIFRDPASGTNHYYYVADGRGGFHRISVP